jgi:hypothetical protein
MGDPDRDTPAPAPQPERDSPRHSDAEAVRLGRFLPLGMVLGAMAGVLAGAVTQRWGICVPVGVALGILCASTLPLVLGRRR